MDPDRAGDAVAFAVDAAPRYGPQHRNRTAMPLCLLRVERRRSDKHAWQRVLDEVLQTQPLQFVWRLERHRYDYRLSLRACDDPLVLALPSELQASRIQSGAGYQHPHVGAFRLVKMEQRPLEQTALPANFTTEGFVLTALVVAALFSFWLFLVTKRKMVEWPLLKLKDLMSSAKSQTQGNSLQTDTEEQKDISAMAIQGAGESPEKIIVFDDFDEDDTEEAIVAKELLMTELPEFNDETGWRDFFDSQIYRREDRQKQLESQEGSGVVRQQRKVITRSSNSIEARTAGRSTGSVATGQAKQPIHPVPTPVTDKRLVASQSSASNAAVVSSIARTASVRQSTDCDLRSETVTSFGITPAAVSSASTKQVSSRTIRPSSPPDDFGEFWQM